MWRIFSAYFTNRWQFAFFHRRAPHSFLGLLSFSLSLPSFSLSVSTRAEIIYWLLQRCAFTKWKKPFWRRHLNASEDKDTMSGRFHSQNKKRQQRSRRNERCNLFRRLFFSRASEWCEKKVKQWRDGMRPSFCEGSCFSSPKLIKILFFHRGAERTRAAYS